jgi:hypothetical protein
MDIETADQWHYNNWKQLDSKVKGRYTKLVREVRVRQYTTQFPDKSRVDWLGLGHDFKPGDLKKLEAKTSGEKKAAASGTKRKAPSGGKKPGKAKRARNEKQRVDGDGDDEGANDDEGDP